MKYRAIGIAFAALTFVTLAFALVGCAGTRSAYNSAETLQDTAYVITEHYAALVHEAADLKEQGNLPPEVVTALREAANASAPLVIGDPEHGVPGLRELAKAYSDVASADNKATLEAAISNGVRAVAAFVKALRAAQQSFGHANIKLYDDADVPSGNWQSDQYVAWAAGGGA